MDLVFSRNAPLAELLVEDASSQENNDDTQAAAKAKKKKMDEFDLIAELASVAGSSFTAAHTWVGVRGYKKTKLIRDTIMSLFFFLMWFVVLLDRRKVLSSFQVSDQVYEQVVDSTYLKKFEDHVAVLNLTTGILQSVDNVTDVRQVRYSSGHSPAEFFSFVNGPIFHFLFNSSRSHSSSNITVDGFNSLVGAIRFRQLRCTTDSTCQLNNRARQLGVHCFGPFSAEYEDGTAFNSPGTLWFLLALACVYVCTETCNIWGGCKCTPGFLLQARLVLGGNRPPFW